MVSGLNLAVVDEGSNPFSAEWSLTDVSGLFQINEASGVISLATATLNYEDGEEHVVVVQAADSNGLITAVLQLTIAVINVLENLTVTDTAVVVNTIEENSAEDTAVSGLSLEVNDEGDNPFSDAVWSLTDSAGDLFQIDETSGVISLAAAMLDYEEGLQTYEVVVQVADNQNRIPPTAGLTLTK